MCLTSLQLVDDWEKFTVLSCIAIKKKYCLVLANKSRNTSEDNCAAQKMWKPFLQIVLERYFDQIMEDDNFIIFNFVN